MEEVFLPIYEVLGRYEISNLGRVRSLFFHGKLRSQPKYLKPGLSKGYWTVVLCVDGNCKTYSIHRLQAMYFIPNPKKYTDINHKDGNRSNNELSNLEWCTHRQNCIHAVKVLDKKNGCKTAQSLFSEPQLINILTLRHKRKARVKDIAQEFNCSASAITNICAGRRYKKEYKRLRIK